MLDSLSLTREPDRYCYWVGAAIGAAAAIGGGLLGGSMSRSEASKLRDWQAQQYGQRYQVTMRDMKAAGLNPMLAYSQGPGSSPTGAMGDMSGVSGGFASAGAIMAQANIRNAQASQTRQTTKKTKEETELAKMKTHDYKHFGDSIAGRNAASLYRMGKSAVKAYAPETLTDADRRLDPWDSKDPRTRKIRNQNRSLKKADQKKRVKRYKKDLKGRPPTFQEMKRMYRGHPDPMLRGIY